MENNSSSKALAACACLTPRRKAASTLPCSFSISDKMLCFCKRPNNSPVMAVRKDRMRPFPTTTHLLCVPGWQISPSGLAIRSEEHTSELQSLMRISYAVFCLKKKTHNKTYRIRLHNNKSNNQNVK